MKLRLFGSHECETCKKVRAGLDAAGITYQFVDAFADDQQDLCDAHDVDELPHIQVINDKGNLVMVEFGEGVLDRLDTYISVLKQ